MDLEGVGIKSKVSVVDAIGKAIYSESRQMSKIGRIDSVVFAIMKEACLKKMAQVPDDMLCISIHFTLCRMVTKEVEQSMEFSYQENANESSLCQDILKMYDNNVQTDVILDVQGEKINTHKFILSARSPVFKKMFQQDMLESVKNVVVIDDVGVHAMKQFVDFLYSRVNLNYDFDTAMNVYYAADKYQVLQLQKSCVDVFLKNLDENNAIQLLLLSDKHKDNSLKKMAMKFISNNFKACVMTNWWIDFANENSQLFQDLKTFIIEGHFPANL